MAKNIFDETRLYSEKQARPVLGIGRTTFRKLVDTGSLPVVKISDRVFRYRGASLNSLCSEKTSQNEE
ncbi:MAG: helix-turn-helix transcriptional regulator [Gammaproteobacteria bacterium]